MSHPDPFQIFQEDTYRVENKEWDLAYKYLLGKDYQKHVKLPRMNKREESSPQHKNEHGQVSFKKRIFSRYGEKGYKELQELKHSFININGKILALLPHTPGKGATRGEDPAIAGQGSFGKVKYAIDKQGNHFIVKIEKKGRRQNSDKELTTMKEVGWEADTASRNLRNSIQHYTIIPYLGEPLSNHEQKPTDEQNLENIDSAIKLSWQVHCAHQGWLSNQGRSIAHHDLKPENATRDKDGRVHLIDWGIAKVGVGLDEEYGNESGTPRYLPFQPKTFSHRALDIIALQRTIYIPQSFTRHKSKTKPNYEIEKELKKLYRQELKELYRQELGTNFLELNTKDQKTKFDNLDKNTKERLHRKKKQIKEKLNNPTSSPKIVERDDKHRCLLTDTFIADNGLNTILESINPEPKQTRPSPALIAASIALSSLGLQPDKKKNLIDAISTSLQKQEAVMVLYLWGLIEDKKDNLTELLENETLVSRLSSLSPFVEKTPKWFAKHLTYSFITSPEEADDNLLKLIYFLEENKLLNSVLNNLDDKDKNSLSYDSLRAETLLQLETFSCVNLLSILNKEESNILAIEEGECETLIKTVIINEAKSKKYDGLVAYTWHNKATGLRDLSKLEESNSLEDIKKIVKSRQKSAKGPSLFSAESRRNIKVQDFYSTALELINKVDSVTKKTDNCRNNSINN